MEKGNVFQKCCIAFDQIGPNVLYTDQILDQINKIVLTESKL